MDGAADVGSEHRVDTAMLLDAAHAGELGRDNFGAEVVFCAREVDNPGVAPGIAASMRCFRSSVEGI